VLDLIHARLEGAFGRERLQRVNRAQVVVIGAGLLGGQLLQHLAMLQVRTLIVDPGTVEPENIGNQGLPADRVGEPKARVRVSQMRELNPSCPVRGFEVPIEELGLGVLADADLILTGLDGRASRLTVARYAQQLGVDWIDAAVDGSGERLLGTISWFRPGVEEQPCYGCRHDAESLARITREERRAPCASWRDPRLPDTPPTLTASPFGALVAGWQMTWALQALLGEEDQNVGHQLQIAASGRPRTRTVALHRRADCLFPHQTLGPLQRLDGDGVEELLVRAKRDLGTAPSALLFPGRSLAVGLGCSVCGATMDLVKLAAEVSDAEASCSCSPGAERTPVVLTDRIEGATLDRLRGRSWSALGIPAEDLVSAESGERRIHYLLPSRSEGEAR